MFGNRLSAISIYRSTTRTYSDKAISCSSYGTPRTKEPRPRHYPLAGGVLFRLVLSWLVLETSGFLEASDGASIHRCHKHVLSTSRNASCANEFEPFSGCSHLPILILHSLSGLLCRLLRALRELKRNLPQSSLKRKKRANSEMSPMIAAHVFSWAWRYNLGITSADAFARDLAGIL